MRTSTPRVPRIVSIVTAFSAVALAAIALFDWNWLRGPISSYLSARVGRPVAIHGDLRGEFSLKPRLVADDVTLANASWGTDPAMARVQRIAVRVDVPSLFGDAPSLPELALSRPVVVLERNADGVPNWDFGGGSDDASAIPRIGRLTIESGVVRFLDPGAGSDISVDVASDTAADGADMPVKFKGGGKLRKSDFAIDGRAATLLALEKSDRPYRLEFHATAGATTARFDGTLVPARLDNVDGSLSLQGRDLSQLYPIIPVPFPWSPPYRLSGNLRHDSGVWSFRQFTGKVGDSDLAGRFDIDRKNGRTMVDADLVSQRLNYKDPGGLIGLPPPTASPRARTAAQNREAAKLERTGRVLPSKTYNLAGLRSIDATVRLKGKRVVATDVPFDNLDAVMRLEDGVLKLQPLDLGVAGGRVATTLTMDVRDKLIRTNAEITARNVDLKQIVPALKPPKGTAGKVGGRARFTATGNSIAEMLATSNGEVALISRGGDASELAIVLTNLDLARAVQLLLQGDANSPIRCVVAHMVSEN